MESDRVSTLVTRAERDVVCAGPCTPRNLGRTLRLARENRTVEWPGVGTLDALAASKAG